MTSTLNRPFTLRCTQFLPWFWILASLCAVYGPTFFDLCRGAWSTEKNAQGPIVMGVALYFFCFRVKQLLGCEVFACSPAPTVGGIILGIGLIFYATGRSQSVLLLEVGSLIVVLSGIVVTFYGVRTWSRMWFVFFFMLFMIPLPVSLVDAVTLPLKIGVSTATEYLLYQAGYPIARNGVILTIGQYQLLVADACAGLHSLFVLEALGLLYMNLVRHSSVVRNVVLATLIVPISFTANTIRIIFLALITYYFGDAAGQGFVHGLSGIVLFVSALLLIISVDSVISHLIHEGTVTSPLSDGIRFASKSVRPRACQAVTAVNGRPSFAIMLAMSVAVAAAHALTPVMRTPRVIAPLSTSVPTHFGEWTEIKSAIVQADLTVVGDGHRSLEQPYDDVLMRTYTNTAGDQIMLALAYAKEQRQDVKIHLPEVCYSAQGYQVVSNIQTPLAVLAGGHSVPGKRLLTMGNGRIEVVSYWVRIGDTYPQGRLATRLKIFIDGMGGYVTDGMLVRASMLINDTNDANNTARAYQIQENFLKDLLSTVGTNANTLVR